MNLFPKVTIYITNYNYEKYISKSIESALKQTYKSLEIIIIDDGSTDNSKKIINNYASRYSNIRTKFTTNNGLIKTCNTALREAKGEYILRLDADDWLDKNAIEIMVNKMNSNKDVEIIFPDYYEVDNEGEILYTIRRHDFDKVKLFDAPAHGACSLFRTKTLILNGGYDENFTCQDGVDIWLRFYRKFKFLNLNIPLFYYRRHGDNLTENKNKILDNKNKILFKNNINHQKKIIAFLPIRGPKYDKYSIIFNKVGKKTIIDWTVDNLLAVKSLDYVVISSPDQNVLKYFKKKKNKKIILMNREPEKATQSVVVDDSVKDSIKKLKTKYKYSPDYILISRYNCPFRNPKHLENAINTIQIFDLDVVYGVSTENALFFKHNGKTLKPLRKYDMTKIKNNSKKIKVRIESDEIFTESGNFVVNKVNNFFIDKKDKIKIGSEALNKLSQFEIKSKFDLFLAQLIANKYKLFNSI